MKQKIPFLLCLLAISLSCFSQKLISYEKIGENSLAAINAAYGFPIFKNGVEHYKITYETPDVHGVKDTASGLLVVPDQFDRTFPLLCFQHGTIGWQTDVPSNLKGGYELAEAWSALGYIVCAPDLLGLGESRGFHPFVHAASEASAALDMIRAASEVLPQINCSANEQLFITGYSQGGHSAAALHKEIQESHAAEFTVTASAPMSGPYSISGVMNDFMYKYEPYFYVGYLPYTLISYEMVYGTLYDELEDVFKPEYAELIRPFAEGTKRLTDLNNELIAKLTEDYGAPLTLKMMKDSVVTEAETNPNHPINVESRKNDVHDWAPNAPTRFYYCTGDDQITYLNSTVADSVMNSNGAPDVDAIDASTPANHTECVIPAVLQASLFFGQYQRIDLVLNSDSPSFGEAFTVFPNPATEKIFINSEKLEGRVELMSLAGKIVASRQLQYGKNEIATGAIPKGVYFVKITSEDSFSTKKIILE